tara:strand:+ start:141 stop:1328 length:1188 start_codon:yes stop_codon:yes gene_type:complete
MADSSGRSSFPERKAGVGPGKQLQSIVTDLPRVEIKKLGVRNPISLTADGANTLLKNMERTGRGLQGALTDLTNTIDKYEKHLVKTQGVDAAKEFIGRLDEAFPDGITSIERRITEARAYENLLYEAGYLEDADPDLKELDKEFNSLDKDSRNKRSSKGKEILAIKETGGVPAVIGRDKDGKLIYHPTKTIPYKLKLSQKGIDEVKNFKLPAYVSANLPAIVDNAKPIEQQTRENKRRFYEGQSVPSGDAPPLANKVVSPKTGIEYDNFNAMKAAEEKAPPRKTLQNLIETPEAPPEELAKPKSKRTVSLMDIIKKGGRKGALMFFPVAGAAATVVDEVLAAKPLNPYRTPEEQEYDRVMEEAKREELIPKESELKGRTMEEVKSRTSRTSFMNQ